MVHQISSQLIFYSTLGTTLLLSAAAELSCFNFKLEKSAKIWTHYMYILRVFGDWGSFIQSEICLAIQNRVKWNCVDWNHIKQWVPVSTYSLNMLIFIQKDLRRFTLAHYTGLGLGQNVWLGEFWASIKA